MPAAHGAFRPSGPIDVSDVVIVGLLAALELVALWLVVRMWRERSGSVASRVVWTVVTLVPVFGLIAHAVVRDPPPPSDPADRPPQRDGS